MAVLTDITFYNNITLDFAHLEEASSTSSDIFVDKYKPISNNNTRSLICFEGGNDSKGVIDDALGHKFSVYRGEFGSSIIVPVYSTSVGQLSIVDYNVRNQKQYQYYVFKESDDAISRAIVTNNLETCWWDYSISGLTLLDAESNTYKINPQDVWLFSSNIASDTVSQNFNKTVYSNLTKYPQISIGQSNYSTGSFSGLIGHIRENSYQEDASLLDQWNDFCANSQIKLYKDRKGHKMIVDISSSSAQVADETREQATTVSIGWTQIGNAEDYVIIGD